MDHCRKRNFQQYLHCYVQTVATETCLLAITAQKWFYTLHCSLLMAIRHEWPTGIISKSALHSYMSGSQAVCSGQLLHNVLTLVFQILTEDPTVLFTISSPTVCLKALLSVLLLPRCNCSFRPQFLMQLLHSCCAPRFFPNVRTYVQGSPCNIVPGPLFPSSLFDRRSCMTASLTPCHSCTVGHPSAGSGQPLPEPNVVLGPFLELSAVPCD
jgi:hypothetical protein